MSRDKKDFDAVEMMRSIREKLSSKIAGMTLDEELKWLALEKLDDPLLERLRMKAGQAVRHGDQADDASRRR